MMYEIINTMIDIQIDILHILRNIQQRLAQLEGDSVESSIIEQNLKDLQQEIIGLSHVTERQ